MHFDMYISFILALIVLQISWFGSHMCAPPVDLLVSFAALFFSFMQYPLCCELILVAYNYFG